MSNEEKINELESRIEKLEKIEKRRQVINIITYSIYGILILCVIGIGIYFYYKIKPYKEKLNALTNWGGSKVDQIQDDLGDYDLFNFDNWFNY